VLLAEAVLFGKRASRKVVAAIVVVCAGVGLSTVTDTQMGSNALGWGVGGGAVLSTAMYQIWAGSKQKELGAGSMQALALPSPSLLHRTLGGSCTCASTAPCTGAASCMHARRAPRLLGLCVRCTSLLSIIIVSSRALPAHGLCMLMRALFPWADGVGTWSYAC
jgi:hypothetical protein